MSHELQFLGVPSLLKYLIEVHECQTVLGKESVELGSLFHPAPRNIRQEVYQLHHRKQEEIFFTNWSADKAGSAADRTGSVGASCAYTSSSEVWE